MQLGQVHNARRHGRDALALQLALRRRQEFAEVGHVDRDEQRAVVERAAVVVIERIAGEFPPGGQNVVAPGEARLDAEGAAGLDDHTLLPVQIVLRRGQAEREIQISHIVIHSAAAGEAAGELPAVLLQKRRAALLPGILIPADDHGMAVLPQIEDAGIRRDRIGQVLLQREVMIRIGVVRAEVQQLPDHARVHLRMGLRAACTSSGRPICA